MRLGIFVLVVSSSVAAEAGIFGGNHNQHISSTTATTWNLGGSAERRIHTTTLLSSTTTAETIIIRPNRWCRPKWGSLLSFLVQCRGGDASSGNYPYGSSSAAAATAATTAGTSYGDNPNNIQYNAPPPDLPPDLPLFGHENENDDLPPAQSQYPQQQQQQQHYPQQQQQYQQQHQQQHGGPPPLPPQGYGNNDYQQQQRYQYSQQPPPFYQQQLQQQQQQQQQQSGGGRGDDIFQPRGDEDEDDVPWGDTPTSPTDHVDMSSFDKDYILKGLARLYRKKILPLELSSRYGHFHSPPLSPSDFVAPPMVLLLGQYRYVNTLLFLLMCLDRWYRCRVGIVPAMLPIPLFCKSMLS
jgi:hypothetical protein